MSSTHQVIKRGDDDYPPMLDEIPGIGEERRKLLLKAFGSVSNLRRQTPEKICEKVPGIGPKLAETVLGHLKKA